MRTRPTLEIYGLCVCFVSLLCFVVSLGVGLYDLVQLATPAFTISAYENERHQSNDRFISPSGPFITMGAARGPALPGSGAGWMSALPSDAEIKRPSDA